MGGGETGERELGRRLREEEMKKAEQGTVGRWVY
jgi:hypothetical protein